VVRRYVADTKRLYFLCSRILHIKIVTEHDVSRMPIEHLRDSIECGKRFFRFTDLLNNFYDHLRTLPDTTLFDRDWVPAPLQQLSQQLLDIVDRELDTFENADAVQVETLAGVLATQPSSQAETNALEGAQTPEVQPAQPNDGSIETSDSFVHEMIHNHFASNSSSEAEMTDMINHDYIARGGIGRSGPAACPGEHLSNFDTWNTLQASAIETEPPSDTLKVIHDDLPTAADSIIHNAQHHTRFTVLDQVLGKGGFGIVYKAWDEEQGRHVACKEVKLGHQNRLVIHELYKEYRVLTTLEHPNIVKVLGFVVHQGNGRIFMEWVPSGSVQSVLQDTKRGLREPIVRRYIREALLGLAYLHSRGIVHRDVKPGNMLLSSEGVVKLTDFGTSRTLEHAAETVQTGTVVGTVPYLAPECVRGTYSAASDIWALGCTALHMITGHAPWAGEVLDHVALIFKLGSLKELPKALLECPMSDDLRAFIVSALAIDRHVRPAANDLLSLPLMMQMVGGTI
jgi:hypothetical protein